MLRRIGKTLKHEPQGHIAAAPIHAVPLRKSLLFILINLTPSLFNTIPQTGRIPFFSLNGNLHISVHAANDIISALAGNTVTIAATIESLLAITIFAVKAVLLI